MCDSKRRKATPKTKQGEDEFGVGGSNREERKKEKSTVPLKSLEADNVQQSFGGVLGCERGVGS